MATKYAKPYERAAKYYDIMWERQTKRDLTFLEWALKKFPRRKIRSILDVACGAGRHTIPLSKKYSVLGTDISKDQLALARKRAKEAGAKIKFIRKDMRKLNFRNRFDAVLCMFTSFNYMVTDDDVEAALKGFYSALKKGGIVILDVMNFIRFLDRHRARFKPYPKHHFKKGQIEILDSVVTKVEDLTCIWHHYDTMKIKDGKKRFTIKEHHIIRIITYPELSYIMKKVGFKNIKCFSNFEDRKEAKKYADRLIMIGVR